MTPEYDVSKEADENEKTDVSSPALTAIYVILMTLIVTGNLLVMLCILVNKAMRTVTNIFIFSLASADLLIGLFVIPATISVIGKTKVTGVFQCTMLPYLQLLSVTASICSMLVICVERYRAIISQKAPWSRLLALKIVAAVWLASTLYAARLFLQAKISKDHLQHLNTKETLNVNDDGESSEDLSDESSTNTYLTGSDETDDDSHADTFCSLFVEEDTTDIYFRVVDFVVIFVLPMVMMTVMYSIIMKRLWAPNAAASSDSMARKRRVVRMCIVVIVCFFICWFPWHMSDIIADSLEIQEGEDEEEEEEEEEGEFSPAIITTMIALSNSFMSPVIYVIFNRAFRQKIWELLVCKALRGRNKVTSECTEETSMDQGQLKDSVENESVQG